MVPRRFDSLLKLAKYDQTNFYHQFTKMPEDKVINLARETWARVNRVNLREYIEPTRNRAENYSSQNRKSLY